MGLSSTVYSGHRTYIRRSMAVNVATNVVATADGQYAFTDGLKVNAALL